MSRPGAPHPDASSMLQLHATLQEYLQMEGKFQPLLCLTADNEPQSGEVSAGARDGAAHVLRCLKVWYDLPVDVFIYAVNLFDRFLTKMKVRPCHVPCITVSCMNIAIDAHARETNAPRRVSVEELVSVSQSACTAGDVQRMSAVLVDKLSLARGAAPVTAAHWLRALAALLSAHAPAQIQLQESALLNLLEIVICDYRCANARSSELALVLLYYILETQLLAWSRAAEASGSPPVPDEAYSLFDIAPDLQAFCNMSDSSLYALGQLVRSVLARYEARAAAPQRQRLVWRLSERTLKVLRPTDRLTSLLPTIEEQHMVDSSPARNRSGSESSECEESSDWPRSPVLPVYCDN